MAACGTAHPARSTIFAKAQPMAIRFPRRTFAVQRRRRPGAPAAARSHLPHRACVDGPASVTNTTSLEENALPAKTPVRVELSKRRPPRARISGAGGNFVDPDTAGIRNSSSSDSAVRPWVRRQPAFTARRRRPDGGDTRRSVHTHSRSSHCLFRSGACPFPVTVPLCQNRRDTTSDKPRRRLGREYLNENRPGRPMREQGQI